MDDGGSDSLVLEFLALLAADRAEGRGRALAEYLALFPLAEAAIAAAYLTALRPPVTESAPGPAGAGEGCRVGPYRIERELGRGGQAVVYLATDLRLGRAVALKVVPRSPLVDDVAPRFRREAELAASLDHPGICTIFDVGHDERVSWIAMRRVEGETLAQRLAAAAPEPLPVPEVLRIGEQAARALHVAHEKGVVHRDVKPSNLMIAPDGGVVVLDFGVARQEHADPVLTRSGDALGTPAYMAPEALTRPAAELGRSVDVFGLGVTLFEAATGQRPFAAPTRDALAAAILDSEPPDARRLEPRVPRDLAIVLETALAKEIDRRYRTALDLAEDLRRVRASQPILARRAGPAVHLLRFCRRNPALALALAALVLALAVGFAVSGALLLETRRTLLQREELLLDYTQLSDQKLARDLVLAERRLWPSRPERAPELERWLGDAEAVLARLPRHRAAAARPARPRPALAERAAAEEAWLREQLQQLLLDLDGLAARVPAVERRLEFCRSVRQLTIDARRADWESAAARVRADPRFIGFELEPQVGLAPLGADPASGLEEFALLESGALPERAAGTRALARAPELAIVLVLIPGGATAVGAEPPSAVHPEGSPHVDPEAGQYDGPVQHLRLDPYFLAKHELTQGQWERHTGDRPASYGTGSPFIDPALAPLHPVETVSWNDCQRVLAELGLALPTEAQWEHGARGGVTTVYATGDDPRSLDGAANLADRYAREHEGHPSWSYFDAIADGYTAHAPVGTFRPNAFGLYDVHGNVAEWCRDTWEDWREVPPRDGDGLCEVDVSSRMYRGGSYSSGASFLRLARRDGCPPQVKSYSTGVRAARAVERGSGD